MSIREGKLLYHLTAVDNLESILSRGLCARNNISTFLDVAEPDIIDFRDRNNLNNYVPFHFFAKNPFDGRVQINYPSVEFAYICVNREFAQQNNFLIIPEHPKSMKSFKMYDYNTGMEIIRWEIMERREYTDEVCKHVCMAERVSPKTILPQDFWCVFIKSRKSKTFVESTCVKSLN